MTTTNNAINEKELKIGSGLRNIGNSCFFNATIQALFHTPILANCFREDTTIACKCIICAAVKTLFEITKCTTSPTDPSMLYKQLKKTNNFFSKLLNGQQQDPHEFFKLLTQMTNEKHPNFTFGNKFYYDFDTEIECSLCKTVFMTKNTNGIADFIVNIGGKRSVRVALQSYFEEDVIEEYACIVCMKKVMAKKKYALISTPECLCITLNRFKNRYTKITCNIEINQELNLKCFVDNEELEFKYRLACVVNHIGKTLRTGHYTTIVNSENMMYKFDDPNVNEATEISGHDAYMLFYERFEKPNPQPEPDPQPEPEELIPIEIVDEDECMENENECTMNDIIKKYGVYTENEVITNCNNSLNEIPSIDDSVQLIPIEIVDEDECMENANECTMNDIKMYSGYIENEVISNGHQGLNEDSEFLIPIQEINSSEINGDAHFRLVEYRPGRL